MPRAFITYDGSHWHVDETDPAGARWEFCFLSEDFRMLHRAERRYWIGQRGCEYCGQPFQPTRSDQRHCCATHRVYANRRRKADA